jgi:hypothetical protein
MNNEDTLTGSKICLKPDSSFHNKDLGLMHYFLGLEVWQSQEKIFLNKRKYGIEILKRFDMLKCKSHEHTHGNKVESLGGYFVRID